MQDACPGLPDAFPREDSHGISWLGLMGRPVSKDGGWWLEVQQYWTYQSQWTAPTQNQDLLLQEAQKYHSKEMPTEVLHKMLSKFFH